MGYDDDTLKPEEDEVLGYGGLTSEVEEDEDDLAEDDDDADDDDDLGIDEPLVEEPELAIGNEDNNY